MRTYTPLHDRGLRMFSKISTLGLSGRNSMQPSRSFQDHGKAPVVVFGCLVASILLLISTTFPASADTAADERRFIELVNELRVEEGVQPLLVDNELRVQAREWSETMAAKDSLEHSTDLASGMTADWALLGENIGVTDNADIDALFDAFVASPTHYQNLVDPEFSEVGVGVVYGPKGKLWTTHRFMGLSEPAPPPPATSPPTTAPPATATPTETVQPTTTEPSAPESTTTTPESDMDVELIADVLKQLDQA